MLSHKEVQESHCSRTICQFEERRARGARGALASTSALFEDFLDPKDVARTENVDIAETADQFEEPISYVDPFTFVAFNRTFH